MAPRQPRLGAERRQALEQVRAIDRLLNRVRNGWITDLQRSRRIQVLISCGVRHGATVREVEHDVQLHHGEALNQLNNLYEEGLLVRVKGASIRHPNGRRGPPPYRFYITESGEAALAENEISIDGDS